MGGELAERGGACPRWGETPSSRSSRETIDQKKRFFHETSGTRTKKRKDPKCPIANPGTGRVNVLTSLSSRWALNFSSANLSPKEKHWDSVPLAGPEARGTLSLPGASAFQCFR